MKSFFVLFIIFPLVTLAGTFGTRGGGDLQAEEFFKILDENLFYLTLSNQKLAMETYQKVKANPFQVRFSEDNLFLDPQQPVQAINDPSRKLIVISRAYWRSFNATEKIKLTLHETLSVLDYQDQDYSVTQNLYQIITDIQKSPLIHWKSKLKIKFKSQLPNTYFVSQKGVFAFAPPVSEQLFCQVQFATSNYSGFYLLSGLKFEKYYFISPDFSSQSNITKLDFISQNKTSSTAFNCKSQGLPGSITPEEITLKALLETLNPIIEKISR